MPVSSLAESPLPYINKKETLSSSFYVIRAKNVLKYQEFFVFVFHKYNEFYL